MTAWLIVAAGLGMAVGAAIWHQFMPEYLGAKGRNLATKEDIQEITRRIEEVKANFARSGFEHQTRFSKLHDRRVEAIDGLYTRLVRATDALYLMFLHGSPDESQASASDAARDLISYFNEHRLYYERELAEHVGKLTSVLHEAWVTLVMDRTNELDGRSVPHVERQRRLDEWRKAKDIVMEETPRLRKEIETMMQRLLIGDTANA